MAATLYKPYVWLEFIETSTSYLHFIVSLPEGKTLVEGLPEPEDDFDLRRRTLNYIIEDSDGGEDDPHTVERSYPLDATTGYDPVLDDIIVNIMDPGSTIPKKGKASTHQSEGDTSGGG